MARVSQASAATLAIGKNLENLALFGKNSYFISRALVHLAIFGKNSYFKSS
jgi:hypothetical protein